MKGSQFVWWMLLAFMLLSCRNPDVAQDASKVTIADSAAVTQPGDSSPKQVSTVTVTYSGGDAAAGPQMFTGKDDATGLFLTAIHTVNIDFVNFVSGACEGDGSLAELLQRKNPITALHVLELNVVDPPTSGGNHIHWSNVDIDGKTYDVLFSNFQEKTSMKDLMVQTPADTKKTPKTNTAKDWDGYVLSGGRFYVIQTRPRQVRLNCPGVVDLEITIAR